MASPPPTNVRPSPSNEQTSSKVLHPIYQALDSHNYSKAVKLTAPPPPAAASGASNNNNNNTAVNGTLSKHCEYTLSNEVERGERLCYCCGIF
eukprot:g2450.t1 g2450   contig12:143222-143500(-)